MGKNIETFEGGRSRGKRDEQGRRSWELNFYADGKRQHVAFYGTKTEARDKREDLRASVRQDTYAAPSKVTVAEFLRDRLAAWQTGTKPIEPKTSERYSELIEAQIAPFIGDIPIQKLRWQDIEGWHADLLSRGRKGGLRGVSAKTVTQAHRVLGKGLDEAIKAGLCQKNVAALQSAPSIDDGEEVTILTEEQVGDVVTKLKGTDTYALFMTLLFTGARRGEVLALKWGAVDLAAKTIEIRAALEQTKKGGIRVKAPKSRAGRRVISLPDNLVDVLREHHAEQLKIRVALTGAAANVVPLHDRMPADAIVFQGAPGQYLSPAALTNRWRRAAKRLKFGAITMHALRHSHASVLIAGGVDPVTVAKRLGHRDATITLRVYSHVFRRRDDKTNDLVNSALSALGRA